ncbi:major facilitator superfamily domain-containing protein [Pyrenochaeta sp. MPI-SDFR-AT-0127]|nr:major facilitator superfamily domain-containing protein [Pyrenochaeta sp. MPI-SDFR-AT-0127]
MLRKHTIPLVYITSFLFLFGESIQPAPRIAIYESVVCHRYHADNETPSVDCKVLAVQEELSLLIGIERLLIIIPSILVIPFAMLADRVGHSHILSLAILGVFLEDFFPLVITWFQDIFPIRLIWLHFMFCFVGGGFTVVITLLHVIVAQVAGEEQRTKVFFRMRAAGVGASVLGYASSGAMMRFDNWLPWIVGLASLVMATVIARMIPVTKAEAVDESERSTTFDGSRFDSLNAKIGSAARILKRASKLLRGNRQVTPMLALVFLCQLGFDAVPLMLAIYISKRFSWGFSDASFLNSLEMLVEFMVLLVLLPHLTNPLPSSIQALRAFKRDQHFAKWSIAALVIGSLVLGLAPVASIAVTGLVILAMGTGQDSLLRSMATDLAPKSELSIIYSAITIMRAIGGSISGPIYAGLYATGMRQGYLGLPFIASGVFFGAALVLCMIVTDTEGKHAEVGSAEDRDLVEPLLS